MVLKMALSAKTCCCKLFQMIVNYSCVRLCLLLLYLLAYNTTGMPCLKIELPSIIGVLLYRTVLRSDSEINVFLTGDCVCRCV